MLFLLCFLSAQKARKRKLCKKSFVLFLYYLTRLPVFTMRDYHVGTHYSIYIKLRRLLLLFHARLFLTKFLSAEKSGTPQRAIIFADIAVKQTYIRLSERFIEAHFSFDCGVVRNKFLRRFLL